MSKTSQSVARTAAAGHLKRSRSGGQSSTLSGRSLVAIFNFQTEELEFAMKHPRAIEKLKAENVDRAVSTLAVRDWTNGSATKPTTKIVSLIVLTKEWLANVVTARIPCGRGGCSLFIQKLRDTKSGLYHMQISESRPENAGQLKLVEWSTERDWAADADGMVMAAIFSVSADYTSPHLERLISRRAFWWECEEVIGHGPSAPALSDKDTLWLQQPKYLERIKCINEDTFTPLKVFRERKRQKRAEAANKRKARKAAREQRIEDSVLFPNRNVKKHYRSSGRLM